MDPNDAVRPNVEAMGVWDDVLADMEATADEYEDGGWEVLQLHPGDVTVLADDERTGFDVLVPDDEFAALVDVLDAGVSFDAYEVYRAVASGMVYFVAVMEDGEAETAVLFPAYYRFDDDAASMFRAAETEGELTTYVRTLSEETVEFRHDDPALFAPPEDAIDGAGDAADAGEEHADSDE